MPEIHSTPDDASTNVNSDFQWDDKLVGSGEVQSVEIIQDWLITNLAEALGVDTNEIDVQIPFTDYGLGSLQALKMSGDLENWLGLKLAPTIVWDYPDIQKLSYYLAQEFEITLSQMRAEEVDNYLQNMSSGKEGG